jgi:hypothetical protein
MSEAILQRNRMTYKVNQPTSVKTRPYDVIETFFTEQEYGTADTMICDFPTGKYYVDPTKSYLKMGVKVVDILGAQTTGGFGRGSCANLINDIRIFHKSGTTITSSHRNDINICVRDYIEKDDFWFQTQGVIQGYGTTTSTLNSENFVDFKIQLSELHGFFKGHNSKLLSPEIVDGLRMELDVNNPTTSVQAIDSLIVDTRIRPSLQICLVKVMDNALTSVNNEANKVGLSWTFDDCFTTKQFLPKDEYNITISIDKAVSVAKDIKVVSYNSLQRTTSVQDSYSQFRPTKPYTPTFPNPQSTEWTYTLGTELYPYKKKVKYGEAYPIVLDTYRTQYGVNQTQVDFVNNGFSFVTNLLTDDYLEMSGDFINTNKRLVWECNNVYKNEDDQSAGDDLIFVSLLTHTKVLRVNDTNSKIDE